MHIINFVFVFWPLIACTNGVVYTIKIENTVVQATRIQTTGVNYFAHEVFRVKRRIIILGEPGQQGDAFAIALNNAYMENEHLAMTIYKTGSSKWRIFEGLSMPQMGKTMINKQNTPYIEFKFTNLKIAKEKKIKEISNRETKNTIVNNIFEIQDEKLVYVKIMEIPLTLKGYFDDKTKSIWLVYHHQEQNIKTGSLFQDAAEYIVNTTQIAAKDPELKDCENFIFLMMRFPNLADNFQLATDVRLQLVSPDFLRLELKFGQLEKYQPTDNKFMLLKLTVQDEDPIIILGDPDEGTISIMRYYYPDILCNDTPMSTIYNAMKTLFIVENRERKFIIKPLPKNPEATAIPSYYTFQEFTEPDQHNTIIISGLEKCEDDVNEFLPV